MTKIRSKYVEPMEVKEARQAFGQLAPLGPMRSVEDEMIRRRCLAIEAELAAIGRAESDPNMALFAIDNARPWALVREYLELFATYHGTTVRAAS